MANRVRSAVPPNRPGLKLHLKTSSIRISIFKIFAISTIGIGVLHPSGIQAQHTPSDGPALPFAPVPSPSVAGPTLQTSQYKPFPPAVSHLKQGAPNVLIILMDDVGFRTPDTFGGPVHTPTLSRIYG